MADIDQQAEAKRRRSISLAKAKLKLQNQQEQKSEEANEKVEEAGLGSKVLDTGLRALDFAGGLARTSGAGLVDLAQTVGQVPEAISQGSLDPLTDINQVTRQGDVEQALKGNAPGSSEFLERGGVPEGERFDILPEDTNIPFTDINIGAGDVSARDIGGFGLDVATDPLNLLTAGQAGTIKSALRAGATPLKTTARKTGKKIFKSAFKELDQVAKRKGKITPPSDVLLKYGISGSNKAVESKTANLLVKLKGQRDSLLAQANEAGASVDIKKAVSPVLDKIAEIKKGRNSIKKDIASRVQTQVNKIVKQGPKPEIITRRVVPGKKPSAIEQLAGAKATPDKITTKVIPAQKPLTPLEASDIKTSIRDLVGDNAFDQVKKTTLGQKLLLELGSGFQKAVEKSADDVIPGLGKAVNKTNDELGTLLTVRQSLTKEAEKAGRKNFFTSVDGALLVGAPGAFVSKKGADALKSTTIRSSFGKLLNQLGEFNKAGAAPGVDTVLRQGAAATGRGNDSRFSGLDK